MDENPDLSNIIYRIQTILRLHFSSTSTYKMFATQNEKILKNATQKSIIKTDIPGREKADAVALEINCNKCGKKYNIYAKLKQDVKIDEDFKKKGLIPFPKDNKLKCDCGVEIDLTGIRNDLESQIGKKIIT